MNYWGLLGRTETGKGLLADVVISRERYAEETSNGYCLHYLRLPGLSDIKQRRERQISV